MASTFTFGAIPRDTHQGPDSDSDSDVDPSQSARGISRTSSTPAQSTANEPGKSGLAASTHAQAKRPNATWPAATTMDSDSEDEQEKEKESRSNPAGLNEDVSVAGETVKEGEVEGVKKMSKSMKRRNRKVVGKLTDELDGLLEGFTGNDTTMEVQVSTLPEDTAVTTKAPGVKMNKRTRQNLLRSQMRAAQKSNTFSTKMDTDTTGVSSGRIEKSRNPNSKVNQAQKKREQRERKKAAKQQRRSGNGSGNVRDVDMGGDVEMEVETPMEMAMETDEML